MCWPLPRAQRRISVEDARIPHGRKSMSPLIDGYNRHVPRGLDRGVVPAFVVTPVNAWEVGESGYIGVDLARQLSHPGELHIDLPYLASQLVRGRSENLALYRKAWPARNGRDGHVPKAAFSLGSEQATSAVRREQPSRSDPAAAPAGCRSLYHEEIGTTPCPVFSVTTSMKVVRQDRRTDLFVAIEVSAPRPLLRSPRGFQCQPGFSRANCSSALASRTGFDVIAVRDD